MLGAMSLRSWSLALGLGIAVVAAPDTVVAETAARGSAAHQHQVGPERSEAPAPATSGHGDDRANDSDRAPHHGERDGSCCPGHSCCASLEGTFAPWAVPLARVQRLESGTRRPTSPDLVRPRFLLPVSLAPPSSR